MGISVCVERMGSGKEGAFVGVVYPKLSNENGIDGKFKTQIVWINVFGFVLLHMAGVYGLWLCLWAKVWTNMYSKLKILKYKMCFYVYMNNRKK